MDKISKLLKKLTSKEREQVMLVLTKLIGNDYKTLDIKKLKGINDVYRARLGDIRIIFRKAGNDVRILEISRRSEDTYRKR